ncbi:MAG TPA: hypothetical protein QGF86_03600 [Nitrospinaceae bacterium]|nr:hypothetical protein [Nitrospinaceae bacterium]HJN99929.1 hypothetical protein [Nitrospinaceae bacterium]
MLKIIKVLKIIFLIIFLIITGAALVGLINRSPNAGGGVFAAILSSIPFWIFYKIQSKIETSETEKTRLLEDSAEVKMGSSEKNQVIQFCP